MSQDLQEAKIAAKEQKASHLQERWNYHNEKSFKAERILQKIDEMYGLRKAHAEKIVKGKEVSKTLEKNIEFWEMMDLKFQSIHKLTPEEIIEDPRKEALTY